MPSRYDVLVAGGGMAGCAAAVAAARAGAAVLLVERADCLGGNATRAMVQPWQSFHACRAQAGGGLPQQVIGGIAQEFVDDLTGLGACLGHFADPIGFAGSITPVDPAALQAYLPGKLAQCGVEYRLRTELTSALLAQAQEVVDATGAAAAARMLGAPVLEPADPQPMSWLFTLQGVDTGAVRDYQLDHPQQFVLHPAFTALPAGLVAVSGFFSIVSAGQASGEFTVPRDRLLFFSTPNPGEVLVNTTRIPAGHADPLREGRRQIEELCAFLPRRVPGFAGARLGRIAAAIGERESCRLQGRHTLSVADIRSGEEHPQAVARGCYPIDIHRSDSAALETLELNQRGYYDIPLGCLEAQSVSGLLCAGRCISADREGFASARVLPTAMATGQAAGLLAAQRAQRKKIDISACLSAISLV